MKFKVGDVVKAITNKYSWTRKDENWEGIVVEVCDDKFKAKTIYSKFTYIIGCVYIDLEYDDFELIELNPVEIANELFKKTINTYKELFDKVDFKYEIKAKKPILDDVEKEYLSNVIKPFRNRIKYIKKIQSANYGEFINLTFFNSDFMLFPHFEKGTMYKGMEPDKKYTLEELGL